MLPVPSIATLEGYRERGLVTRVDRGPISVYNYSRETTYSDSWDEVTLVARGLIINRETGEIVARAFDKFFNWGEKEISLPSMIPDVTTIKWDGALGIGYRFEGDFYWSTRGSFYSPHAESANRLWKERWSDVIIPDHLTPLVEIITKEAKILIPYEEEDLVLLGIRNRHTGEDLTYEEVLKWGSLWRMKVTPTQSGSIPELLAIAKRMTHAEEGFVLRFGDTRIKIKSQEYCLLARLVSGLTRRALADLWYHGDLSVLEGMPSPHREDSLGIIAEYQESFDAWKAEICAEADKWSGHNDMKSVAMALREHPAFGLLMRIVRSQNPDMKEFWYKKEFGKMPRSITSALDDDSEG